MTHKGVKKALMISFLTALLILSTVTAVFPASAGSSSNFLEGQPDGPPDDVGPVRPDLGEMTRRIGSFEEGIGSFVSFEPMEKGISNHSIRIGEDEYLTIFDKVSVEEFGKYDERVAGHTYFLKGNAAEFRLYDTPTTILKLNVYSLSESGRQVSFRLGDMDVVGDEREREVSISNEVYSGSLICLDMPGHAQRRPEENDGFINFTVEDRATFIFRMEMDGFENKVRSFVREKMREGRIGAEFRIESTDEGYSHISASYRDVNMEARMRDENTLDILVSSETLGNEGTLLLLDISSTVMDISSKDSIDLLFDGEIADFTEDITELDESDDPSYTFIPGEEGTHILVNVPNFSTHSITIEYMTYLGSLTYYISAVAASAGFVALGLIYRKHDRKEGKKNDKDQKDRRVSLSGDPKNYKKGNGNENRIKSAKKDKKKKTRVRKD